MAIDDDLGIIVDILGIIVDGTHPTSGREAKFYSLTRAGRKQLTRELKQWDRLSSAVLLLLNRTTR